MHRSFVPPCRDIVPGDRQRGDCRVSTRPGIEKHSCSRDNAVHTTAGGLSLKEYRCVNIFIESNLDGKMKEIKQLEEL